MGISVLVCGLAYGQNSAPPEIPANPPAVSVTPKAPAPTPVAPPVIAKPKTQIQAITLPPQYAEVIRDAIAKLPPEDTGTWAAFFRIMAANHPTLALLIGLRGLLGIIGLPIHTFLDRYLQKHLNADRYAKVHTEGSTLFKQMDWLVNLVFSIKPSTVMAASSITKVSTVPPDPVLKQ